MKRDTRRIALLTKWAFEAYADPDVPEILPVDDVAGYERGAGRNLYAASHVDQIDNLESGSLGQSWDRDAFGHETDPVGGWIVESPEGIRIEFDLFDPEALAMGHIARSHALHRMHALLWL